MKKVITYTFSVIYIVIIVGIIEMLYDDNPNNDHYGQYLLIVMMFIQGIHYLLRDKLENKKSRKSDYLFVLVTVGLLIWASTAYLT
ncbi:hypothetical protein ACSVDE_02815 [Pseudalkalibacillus sp. Hm43]|uniref:hypothetical protein n=1 Tax=Pseudalkalibacillus sp. Hm43 TaxID=3450742 RepID=UPI003F431459